MKKIDAILTINSAMTEKLGYALEGSSFIDTRYNDEIESVMELYFTGNSCYLSQLQFFLNTIAYGLDSDGINDDLKKVLKRFSKRLDKYSVGAAVDIVNRLRELAE